MRELERKARHRVPQMHCRSVHREKDKKSITVTKSIPYTVFLGPTAVYTQTGVRFGRPGGRRDGTCVDGRRRADTGR